MNDDEGDEQEEKGDDFSREKRRRKYGDGIFEEKDDEGNLRRRRRDAGRMRKIQPNTKHKHQQQHLAPARSAATFLESSLEGREGRGGGDFLGRRRHTAQ